MAHRLTSSAARRIAVIGNAGGGKSTLARAPAAARSVPYIEVDRFLWEPDWQPAAGDGYALAHDRALAGSSWVIDGLGRRESIAARLHRSSDIVLVDLPLWIDFWLAAERQFAWSQGQVDHPPAGASAPPPTEALFRTIWEVDPCWMPGLRQQIARAEAEDGKAVTRIGTLEKLNELTARIPAGPRPRDVSRRAGSPASGRRRASRRP
jgi:adenylate kinase family enzyme